MSPFRPDLVDVWIFRIQEGGRRIGFGSVPGPDGRSRGSGGAGGAGAAAPGGRIVRESDVDVLLLRRSPGRILPGLWQCVSGSLETGESVTEGALRELREETGFGPERIEAFFDIDQVNQFHEPSVAAILTSAVFAVRVGSDAEPVLSHEHDSMRWVSPAEAVKLAVWPAYRESIRRIEENLLDPERASWFELTLAGERARRG